MVVSLARHHLDGMSVPPDPFALDDGKVQHRIDSCGKGVVRRFSAGRIREFPWMCGMHACDECAAWKVEKGPAAWLRLYDRMIPPLFSGVDVVYWQPVPLGGASPTDVPEVRRLADRARDRGITDWTRIDTVEAANYFSAAPLHKEGDAEYPWTMTAEVARRFYFGELLLPGVVQRKPTAGSGSSWALMTDKEGKRLADEGKRLADEEWAAAMAAAGMEEAVPEPKMPSIKLSALSDRSWSPELNEALMEALAAEWPDVARSDRDHWSDKAVRARVAEIDAELNAEIAKAVKAKRQMHAAMRRR